MRRLLAIASVAVAAIAAGCGGEGETSSAGDGFSVRAHTTMTAAEQLTRPEFVERVDGICRQGWRTILGSFAAYSGEQPRRLSETRLFAKSIRGVFMASLDINIYDRIRDLGAPPGEEEAIEEIIGAMQEGVERGKRQVRVTTPAQLEALFVRYNQLAREYGLHECQVSGTHLPHANA